MYKLVIVHKGKIHKNIPLRHESMIIGRKSECDIHLEEKQVSSRHAEVILRNNEVILKDLGSTNGTSVNGSVIQELKLQTGDQISIGSYKLIFVTEHGDGEDPDATVALSARPSAKAPGKQPASTKMLQTILLILAILLAGGLLFIFLG